MGSGRTLAVHMYVLSSEGLYMDRGLCHSGYSADLRTCAELGIRFLCKAFKQSHKRTVSATGVANVCSCGSAIGEK